MFFHNKRHPIKMGKLEIEQFLTHLSVNIKVSPMTQNQALRAQERKNFVAEMNKKRVANPLDMLE